MTELHDDQERYAERVAGGTGLDVDVVRAWVAGASGPGVYRPGHDYLVAGRYPDVDTAARAAIAELRARGLHHHAATGQLAQLATIGADPELPGTIDSIAGAWAR